MNIKIIEPIGQSEAAIRARLKDLLEKAGHHLSISDTRGLSDADLIQNIGDADILLLSNRPLSRAVIEACPNLKLKKEISSLMPADIVLDSLPLFTDF